MLALVIRSRQYIPYTRTNLIRTSFEIVVKEFAACGFGRRRVVVNHFVEWKNYNTLLNKRVFVCDPNKGRWCSKGFPWPTLSYPLPSSEYTKL